MVMQMRYRLIHNGHVMGEQIKEFDGNAAAGGRVQALVIRHQLEYSMYSTKVTWCPICKEHFYNDSNNEHTTIATKAHFHERAV